MIVCCFGPCDKLFRHLVPNGLEERNDGAGAVGDKPAIVLLGDVRSGEAKAWHCKGVGGPLIVGGVVDVRSPFNLHPTKSGAETRLVSWLEGLCHEWRKKAVTSMVV